MERRELAQRKKRIGRKAIATVRVAITIDRKLDTNKPTKKKLQLSYEYRRWHLYAVVGAIVLIVVGIIVFNIVNAQISTQRAADQARQQKIDEAAAKKRDVCRAQVTAQKSAQVGTLTYDQLYGNEWE